MEEQSRDLTIEIQRLETLCTEMLQNVKPSEEHGFHMQCINRVPPNIRENNPKAYTPQIVSIGPYHHKANNSFEPMEEHKLKYLKGFLNRTQLPIREFVVKIKELEEDIRLCYTNPMKFNRDDFLKMILVDACFIIELFLRMFEYNDWKQDPLFVKPWIQVHIQHDLILLENQLPFFVLEQLYNLTGMGQNFLDITFKYFRNMSLGNVCPEKSPKHFTDFLRSSAISSSKLDLENPDKYFREVKQLYSASQLKEAGLKFKASTDEGLLDLTYLKKGVLTMPILNIYDGTEIIFRNIMAYEQCQLLDEITFTQYVAILDFLINTEKDVNLLVDKKIIVNWTGDSTKVVTMINNLSSDLMLPYFHQHYFSLCNSLNDFYENPRNKYKAIFVHEYFNTPWKIASTTAAIMLIFLTFIQAVCSIVSIFYGKKS